MVLNAVLLGFCRIIKARVPNRMERGNGAMPVTHHCEWDAVQKEKVVSAYEASVWTKLYDHMKTCVDIMTSIHTTTRV